MTVHYVIIRIQVSSYARDIDTCIYILSRCWILRAAAARRLPDLLVGRERPRRVVRVRRGHHPLVLRQARPRPHMPRAPGGGGDVYVRVMGWFVCGDCVCLTYGWDMCINGAVYWGGWTAE